MKIENVIQDLFERGLIKNITGEDKVDKLIQSGKSVYCGFDPTADSLHVGSLLPLITLLRLKRAGVSVKPLIGGATGMIGDPSFKENERSLNTKEVVDDFKNKITIQIKKIIGEDVKVVDNFEWTKDLNILDFLRDTGKFFAVNTMLKKDSVKSRIERDDQGISFTEFTYQILQGMDFHHLFKHENCAIQMGGSDQWGNMIAGIDLINKKENQAEVGVFTLPLLLKSDGQKFGKSETGTVWLSEDKTSPFQFFQFWLNISDEEVKSFFKMLSLKPIEEIQKILNDDKLRDKPMAQQILAEELTEIVHGKEALREVLSIKKVLFEQNWNTINEEDLNILSEGKNIKTIKVNRETINGDLIQLLVDWKILKSKRESREMIKNNAIRINGEIVNFEKCTDVSAKVFPLTTDFLIFNKFMLIQKGKKIFTLIKF
jgi:tyrosyl-tRNA synthetase